MDIAVELEQQKQFENEWGSSSIVRQCSCVRKLTTAKLGPSQRTSSNRKTNVGESTNSGCEFVVPNFWNGNASPHIAAPTGTNLLCILNDTEIDAIRKWHQSVPRRNMDGIAMYARVSVCVFVWQKAKIDRQHHLRARITEIFRQRYDERITTNNSMS